MAVYDFFSRQMDEIREFGVLRFAILMFIAISLLASVTSYLSGDGWRFSAASLSTAIVILVTTNHVAAIRKQKGKIEPVESDGNEAVYDAALRLSETTSMTYTEALQHLTNSDSETMDVKE